MDNADDILWMDHETLSEIDLSVRGLDNYVRHPSTRVTLTAYARGDRVVKAWEHHLNSIPDDLRDYLESPFITVMCWNATFDQAITAQVLGIQKPISEFRDPMCQARYLSLPGSLEDVGEILGLSSSTAKMAHEGKRLIKIFAEPESVGGENTLFGTSMPTFRTPETNPAEWKEFVEYCRRDVIAMRTIYKKLAHFPLPESEWETWLLDQKINARGLPVSMQLVSGAQKIVDKEIERLLIRLREITNLENPNSTVQFLDWVRSRGYIFSSIGKAFVARALTGECSLTEEAKEALIIRGQTARSSVKKYTNIADTVGPDGRLRYQYTYYGASRTGRWAAHGVNVGNLSKPTKEVEKKMDRAIELVRQGAYEIILSEFGKPLDVVSSTVRSSFEAPKGMQFAVSDLGSIENRVLGWVSRCDKILNVFRSNFKYEGPDYPEKEIFSGMEVPMDPYLDFATRMYGQSYHDLWVEWKIKGDSTKRTNSKAPVLGAGFMLGPGKEELDTEGNLVRTGLLGYAKALGVDMSLDDAVQAIKIFRSTYLEVTWYWKDIQNAAIRAIKNPGEDVGVGVPHTNRERERYEKIGHPLNWEPLIFFRCHGTKVLEMRLPSGRSLFYMYPRVLEEDAEWEGRTYKKQVVYYQGKEQGSQVWGECIASSGRFTENSVQSLARDILVNGMKEADREGFEIVLHVYDEVGALVPIGSRLDDKLLSKCLTKPLPWAPGLPLVAEGYCGPVYKKG
jgi:DNA polymerase